MKLPLTLAACQELGPSQLVARLVRLVAQLPKISGEPVNLIPIFSYLNQHYQESPNSGHLASQALWAAHKLDFACPALLVSGLTHLKGHLPLYQPREAALILWCAAKARQCPFDLGRQVCEVLVNGDLTAYGAGELSTLSYALLKFGSPASMEAVLQAGLSVFHSSRSLGNLAFVGSKMCPISPILLGFLKMCQTTIWELPWEHLHLQQILTAAVAQKVADIQFGQHVLNALKVELKPEVVTNILVAAGALSLKAPPFLGRLLAKSAICSRRHWSLIGWAVAKLEYSSVSTLDRLLCLVGEAFLRAPPDDQIRHYSNLLHGLLAIQNFQLETRIFENLQQDLLEYPASPQSTVIFLHVMATRRHNYLDPKLFNLEGPFDEEGLPNLLWAAGKLGVQLPASALDQAIRAAQGPMDIRNLQNILFGVSELLGLFGYPEIQEPYARLCMQVLDRLPEFWEADQVCLLSAMKLGGPMTKLQSSSLLHEEIAGSLTNLNLQVTHEKRVSPQLSVDLLIS